MLVWIPGLPLSLQQAATQPLHNQRKNSHMFPLCFHIFLFVNQKGPQEALEKSS